jgi:hypothetical protein
MNQQNVYAQSNYSQVPPSRIAVSSLGDKPSSVQPANSSRYKEASNDSLNLTPKPQRKVLRQTASSEGSISDESDASN